MNNRPQFAEMFGESALLRTWSEIRQDIKTLNARDCLDYLEYEVDIRLRVTDLRKRLKNGTYEPRKPAVFELAKSKGAYRSMAMLHIEDALVYRTIADEIYRRARTYEVKGSYFTRKHKAQPVGPKQGQLLLVRSNDFYKSVMRLWLRYHQYRTRTMLNAVRPVLLVTDITNYFESIHHELLLEHLAPLGLPRKTISLLAKLLETFKPLNGGYSPNPRTGLPVDEFDASRQLAHVFLFEHDARVVANVGLGHYVRWMDDQTLAFDTMTHARQGVRQLTRSLADLRLVLNSGKTKFLRAQDTVVEFHLDANYNLDELNKVINKGKVPPGQLIRRFRKILREAAEFEGRGHWDKVLKRIYYAAGRLKWHGLRGRVYQDLIDYPAMSDRIFGYLVSIQEFGQLLRLFKRYVTQGESLYESVETTFFEVLLETNVPNNELRTKYREFSKDWIIKPQGTNRSVPKGVAALALYWLGDRRSLRTIQNLLSRHGRSMPNSVARTLMVALIALDNGKVQWCLDSAAEIGGPAVTSLASLLRKLIGDTSLDAPPNGLISQRSPFHGPKIFETRAWLKLEILRLARSPSIQTWIGQQRNTLKAQIAHMGSCELRAWGRFR